MRFQATHKLVSYLLVVIAIGSLAAAGLASPWALALSLVGLVLSWFAEPTSAIGKFVTGRGAMPARVLAVAFLGLTVWEVAANLPEPDLSPVIALVLFLVVFKLFHRRSNRDYLHIYILAFLLMLAAAAFAQSAAFLLGFLLYVLLTTWTLMLFHLRREMEENYLVKHSSQAPSQKVGVHRILNSRRVVGAWFFVLTASVAFVIFAGALMTFMLVPRVGAGFVLGGPKPRRFLVGFADEVTLGQSGFLSVDNRDVAFRARLAHLAALGPRAREGALDQLYWRGTVYDTYDHGHWTRSRTPALATDLEPLGARLLVREPGFHPDAASVGDAPDVAPFPPLANAIRQEIEIVGLQVPVAFALDQPVAFELGDAQPGLGATSELRFVPRWSAEVALRLFARAAGRPDDDEGRTAGGARYVAYSRDSHASVTASAGLPTDTLDPDLVRPYLSLPPELGARVRTLATDLTRAQPTAAGKMQAILDWLAKTHRYSLELKRRARGEDPIEDFLFEQSAGHCEYFATSAALLLRAAGVPTRYVNGFLGGEWNALGQHVTVRQNRAHAWTEAYLGRLGWVRVDATPPIARDKTMSKLRELADSLELLWSRWVVSYDFAKQVELARSFGQSLGLSSRPRGQGGGLGAVARHRQTLLSLLGLATVAWLAWRWRRRPAAPVSERLRSSSQETAIGQLYEKALRRLAARGFSRRLAETPREFLERARAAELGGLDVLSELTLLYERTRFGGVEAEGATVRALARRLSHLAPPAGTGVTKTTAA